MKVEKMTDNDGDWYWIPNQLVGEFRVRCTQLDGKDYMDDPDKFDEFCEKFDKYATGGDSSMCPDILLPELEEELDNNMKLISDFMKHYKYETGKTISENVFLSFFNA